MSLPLRLNRALEKLPVYLPGKPISEVARELGLDPQSIIKLASNENPLGPSPKAMEAIQRAIPEINIYPDGSSHRLKKRISEKLDIPTNCISFGNGSNELLELIAHAVLQPGDECVMSQYCFAIYPIVTRLSNAEIITVPAKDYRNDLEAMLKAITPKTQIVFLANPNNPTGTFLTQEELGDFIDRVPERTLIVLDEAYTEYHESPPDFLPLIREGKKSNLVICWTFSKIYGLAGLRIGFSLACPEFTQALEKVREAFNTNSLAQEAALAALDDVEFLEKARRVNNEGLAYLQGEFDEMGLEYVRSYANFVLVKTGNGSRVFEELQRAGIIVRPVNNYGLPEWIRITVGIPEQNQRVIQALKRILPTLAQA